VPNLKSVALIIFESLAFNAEKFRGSVGGWVYLSGWVYAFRAIPPYPPTPTFNGMVASTHIVHKIGLLLRGVIRSHTVTLNQK